MRHSHHMQNALPYVLLAGVSLPAITFPVSAEPVSFQFNSTLTSIDATDHPDFGNSFSENGLLSGMLTYETDTPVAVSEGNFSFFEFPDGSGSSNTLRVNELDHSFQLSSAEVFDTNSGPGSEGDSFGISTFEESVGMLNGDSIGFYFSLFDEGAEMLSTPTALPSDIDFGLVDYGDMVIFGNDGAEFAFAEITSFFMDIGGDQGPGIDQDGNLILGTTQPESFTLEAGELLDTNKTVVGQSETANFFHTGGEHRTDRLDLAGDIDDNSFGTPGSGSYTLESGTVISDWTNVGMRGEGQFTQTGGTNIVDLLILGNSGSESSVNGPTANGVGTYDLSGGALEVGLSGMLVGASGQGTFNQNGGVVTIGNELNNSPFYGGLKVGDGTSRYDPDNFPIPPSVERGGTYNLADGGLTVYGNIVLGGASDFSTQNFGGRGAFVQTGGTSFVGQNVIVGEVGEAASGNGEYVISGGALDVAGDIRVADNSSGGRAAKGLFLQTGGAVTAGGNITIGEGDTGVTSSYRVQGGSTTANKVIVGLGNESAGSAFLEVGNGGMLQGDVFINGNGTLMGADGSIDGTVTLQGGTLAPGASPGTMSIMGDLILNDGLLELEFESSGTRDFLAITGDIFFGKDLMIDILFGFEPTGDVFDLGSFFDVDSDVSFADGFDFNSNIMFSGLLEGQNPSFTSVSLFGESYALANGGSVAVSEPGTLALFGLGLGGLLVAAGRRRSGQGVLHVGWKLRS